MTPILLGLLMMLLLNRKFPVHFFLSSVEPRFCLLPMVIVFGIFLAEWNGYESDYKQQCLNPQLWNDANFFVVYFVLWIFQCILAQPP